MDPVNLAPLDLEAAVIEVLTEEGIRLSTDVCATVTSAEGCPDDYIVDATAMCFTPDLGQVVVLELRRWSRLIERDDVQAHVTKRKAVNASTSVFATTGAFHADAIKCADQHAVALLQVRDSVEAAGRVESFTAEHLVQAMLPPVSMFLAQDGGGYLKLTPLGALAGLADVDARPGALLTYLRQRRTGFSGAV